MESGAAVLPVYIMDPIEDAMLGGAARWRLMRSLEQLSQDIKALGGRLLIRRGEALTVLRALVKETGAEAVHWSRYYEPRVIERDRNVKAALRKDGVAVERHPGFLLREPFSTETQTGGFYKVYTPFKNALREAYEPGAALAPPKRWPAPGAWPESLDIADLKLDAPMRRGAAVLARAVGEQVGETAALSRLEAFLQDDAARYAEDRDRLDRRATSRLSAPLSLGEISPRLIWIKAQRTGDLTPDAGRGVEKFLDEVVWRDFAWHLAFHTPHMLSSNWREGWDDFPWRGEEEGGDDLEAWRRGRTGVAVVDAAMRELYVTGLMHNRARMITASYLTKNLMIDWRLGERWFADCLIDFDPASNAMGWQWVAGSGPDAAPFFRIFNPETQAEKFDPEAHYRAHWLPERYDAEPSLALEDGAADRVDGSDFFDACPRSWSMSPDDPAPKPSISLKAGRERALGAYQTLRKQ